MQENASPENGNPSFLTKLLDKNTPVSEGLYHNTSTTRATTASGIGLGAGLLTDGLRRVSLHADDIQKPKKKATDALPDTPINNTPAEPTVKSRRESAFAMTEVLLGAVILGATALGYAKHGQFTNKNNDVQR
ncbi:MAG: hypothetical protein MK052_05330 [Alphaproteobacteria bacterium]|nr:hypothetical protein [Alphaproteobacteria bacterium]